MEEIKNDNAITYEQDGCVFVVHREFTKGGTSILEQVIAMLIDLMEKSEQLNKIN